MELIKRKVSLSGLLLILSLSSFINLVGMHEGACKKSNGDESKQENNRTEEHNEIGEKLLAAIRNLNLELATTLLDLYPELINYTSRTTSDLSVSQALLLPRDVENYLLSTDTSTPLLAALGSTPQHFALMNELLNRGADPLMLGSSNHLSIFFETIRLSYTSTNQAVAAAEKIITFLAQRNIGLVNAHGRCGQTPLQFAIMHAPFDIVVLLLKLGAQVNARDERGWTALHYALYNISPCAFEVVRELLSNGADPRLTDTEGRTADQVADAHCGSAPQLASLVARARFNLQQTNSGADFSQIDATELASPSWL